MERSTVYERIIAAADKLHGACFHYLDMVSDRQEIRAVITAICPCGEDFIEFRLENVLFLAHPGQPDSYPDARFYLHRHGELDHMKVARTWRPPGGGTEIEFSFPPRGGPVVARIETAALLLYATAEA